MVNNSEIKEIVKRNPKFKNLIFERGFLITDSDVVLSDLDFCGDWKCEKLQNFNIWIHPDTQLYINKNAFLIGHAYNHVTMQIDENEILETLMSYVSNDDRFYTNLGYLTGAYMLGYVKDGKIYFYSDATSIFAFYIGVVENKLYITSHVNIVDLIAPITRDPFVDKLSAYRFYHYFGISLPGDLSPFLQLKLVQPNFEYSYVGGNLSFKRIFPTKAISYCKTKEDYDNTIEKIADVISTNMNLINMKYGNKAWLSLTGGRDSTTALSGAHGFKDDLQCFSYISWEGEKYDADAAAEIAKYVGTNHKVYNIDFSLQNKEDVEDLKRIIEYNMGNIGVLKEKEVRKRLYFLEKCEFEVEIKSWVDEIGRARLHKRYLKKSFPTMLKPRMLTTIYKVFGARRDLALKTDKTFKDYLNKYYSDNVFEKIPWWDLIYWEYLWGANESLAFTNEHRIAFEVTIPFNNRYLLELMLSVPLENRIADTIQVDVIKKLMPQITESGIYTKDFGWNKKREISERIYYDLHNLFPF